MQAVAAAIVLFAAIKVGGYNGKWVQPALVVLLFLFASLVIRPAAYILVWPFICVVVWITV